MSSEEYVTQIVKLTYSNCTEHVKTKYGNKGMPGFKIIGE